MTGVEWDDMGGVGRLYADFSPIESDVVEYADRCAGPMTKVESWIDPEGRIYLCRMSTHESLALRLGRCLGIQPEGSIIRDGDHLFDRGWIKTFWDKVFVMGKCTQRQNDTLFDLLVLFEEREVSQALCSSIRETLPKTKLEEEW